MSRTIVVLLAVVLALAVCTGAFAQSSEVQELRNQVKQLQQQLQQVLDRLQKLEAAPTAPVAATPPPAPAPVKTNWADKLTVNGYFQARYEQRADSIDDFGIRRMYLNVLGNINDRTYAQVSLVRAGMSVEPRIDLDAAFVDYTLSPQYVFRIGQIPNTFGWDASESSSRRLPFERFPGSEGISGRPDRPGIKGVWFGGASDRGVALSRLPQGPNEPLAMLTVMNGNFRESDNNNNKAVQVDLRWTKPVGVFGLSWLKGDYTPVNPDGTLGAQNPRNAVNLFFHRDPQPWGLQSEFIDGKLLGHKIRGWYGQVARSLGKGTPFVRYETYDPARDVPSDTYTALHLGYAYQVDKNNKVTLEWVDANRDNLNPRNEVDYGNFGLQWQCGF